MTKLKKVLSFKVITLITINSIIGSGIFFLPAIAARISGPASIISWILLSITAILTALLFAELVAMFPYAGGIYEFSKQAYGRFPSFIIGWIAWLVGNITTAMLIVGAIQYLLPYQGNIAVLVRLGFSIFWIVIFNYMTYRGMKTSAFMLVTFAIITLATMFLIIFINVPHLSLANLKPFFIHKGLVENLIYIFITIFFISEAFFGLESVCFLAEETKEPEKNLPRALIIANIIIASLTIILVFTSLSALSWKEFSKASAPFAYLANKLAGNLASNIITILTYLLIIGAAAGWIVTTPRLILALTRDKLFLPQFKEIHPKYNTPSKAIVFQAVSTIIFVLMASSSKGYETLLSLLIPLVLIMMSLVIITVPVLRVKKKNLKRPFRAPFALPSVILLISLNIFLIIMWILHQRTALYLFIITIALILFGIPIYLLIELYYDPKFIRKVNDVLAYLALFTERIMLPKKVRKEVLRLVGNVKNKAVLEYGTSVGTFTLLLAEAVKPRGKVYTTDISLHRLKIAIRRLNKRKHYHVKVFHDKPSRVHPNIPDVDVAISIGALSSSKYINRVLRHINKRLDIGDKIVVLDYDKFFHIIPNIEWMTSNKKIKELFAKNGFDVTVIRKRGLLWQYVYIHGKKVKDVK